MQPGKWIAGWFTKRSSDAAPVEYSNYEGLSNDPLAGSSASTQNAAFSGGGIETGGLGITQSITKELWDLNGDSKLSKLEADVWWLTGEGKPITVDNSYINWSGLEMDDSVGIDGPFSISTTNAFKMLPFETAATYGGTSFVRTGKFTAEVREQPYHYDLRDWNKVENIKRNIMNEIGNPSNYINSKGTEYMIHYRNPRIKFNQKFDIYSHKYIPGVRDFWWDKKYEKTIYRIK